MYELLRTILKSVGTFLKLLRTFLNIPQIAWDIWKMLKLYAKAYCMSHTMVSLPAARAECRQGCCGQPTSKLTSSPGLAMEAECTTSAYDRSGTCSACCHRRCKVVCAAYRPMFPAAICLLRSSNRRTVLSIGRSRHMDG